MKALIFIAIPLVIIFVTVVVITLFMLLIIPVSVMVLRQGDRTKTEAAYDQEADKFAFLS